MQDEDRAAWWAIWGMAKCPACGRLVKVGWVFNTPHFESHPPQPLPACPQSGRFHAALAILGIDVPASG